MSLAAWFRIRILGQRRCGCSAGPWHQAGLHAYGKRHRWWPWS